MQYEAINKFLAALKRYCKLFEHFHWENTSDFKRNTNIGNLNYRSKVFPDNPVKRYASL